MHPTLTFRQERFVFEYLKDQNASAAAARAGYTASNLASQGNDLMKNPAVRERVRLEMQGLLADLRCSALELMRERMRAAFFRGDKLVGENWQPVPLDQLDADTRDAVLVSTVMRKNGPVVRVRQPDRDKALRALERLHERMDKLNEQYWAKLEKDGLLPSLEEVEAMDGGGVQCPGHDFSQKHQVLSGSGEPGQGGEFDISEKHQVLSGWGEEGRCRTVSFDGLRTNGEGANFSEKHQVLSGSQAHGRQVEGPPFARVPLAEALALA